MKNQNTMPAAQSGGRKFRNDIILILSLLVVFSLVGLFVFLSGEDGVSVSVTLDGKAWGTFPLSEDREIEIISGKAGDGYNILVIENGHAYVKAASCPDGICSAHRPISRSGESIICLPNKVVVTVNAQGEEDIIS